MVNGTLLNFGKRYEDNLRVIFDQWPKLHLGLDVLSNQKILKGTYYTLLLLCRIAVPATLACVAWWLKQIHTYLQILTQSSFLSWQMHATKSKAFKIHTK